VHCSVLQCVAVCCSVLPCVWSILVPEGREPAMCCSVLQCVAVCCSVLQCVAVCCSMLQCLVEFTVDSDAKSSFATYAARKRALYIRKRALHICKRSSYIYIYIYIYTAKRAANTAYKAYIPARKKPTYPQKKPYILTNDP